MSRKIDLVVGTADDQVNSNSDIQESLYVLLVR